VGNVAGGARLKSGQRFRWRARLKAGHIAAGAWRKK